MSFLFTWIFDKLGYMPKIDFQVGKVDLKAQEVWPFPVEKEVIVPKKKPAAKKAKVVAKTARTKKAK